MKLTKEQADSAFITRLARAMMTWNGDFPYNIRFEIDGRERWIALEDAVRDPGRLAQVQGCLLRTASEGRERYMKTGKGIRKTIDAMTYANVVRMFVNCERNKPVMDGVPFPLPKYMLRDEAG